MNSTISWIALAAEGADLRAFGVDAAGRIRQDWHAPLAEAPARIAGWRGSPGPGGLPAAAAGLDHPAPRALPCPPLPQAPDLPRPDAAGVTHLPGLMQTNPPLALPAAATARIGGVLAADPGFDGVICLPGPRCIWAQISAGEVVSAVATADATLATAFGLTAPAPDDPQFLTALSDTLSRPERMLRHLGAPEASAATQAGSLIGAALAATRPWWLGQPVRVLGRGDWPGLYAAALAAQGVAAVAGDGDAALVAGLARILPRAGA